MKEYIIINLVEEASKKYGINYISPYHSKLQSYEDALKLRNVYRQLKEMLGVLQEIEERHHIEGLGKILSDTIQKLYEADHDLVKIATKLGEGFN